MKKYFGKTLVAVFLLSLIACKKDDTLFHLVPSRDSGIDFKNTLTPTVDFNIINYMYFFNGGGVAVGDFNGDNLVDIYFTANQETNRLYMNLGGLKFKDVTEIAGVKGLSGWTTGVTTVDINGDGRLDIYVSYLGGHEIHQGRNQLFINEGQNAEGIPTFTDRAVDYGLDLVGFSTQAAFLDYDRDNDLDMFLLTHSLHQQGTFGKATLRDSTHALAGDKLMRNDNGHFVNVTRESGIYSSVLGYGLGVVVSDVNLDGWPDIYVGNDFHENDYLYINQGDGTFQESIQKMMNHTSRFTMGVDFADINNDAFPDLISADMLSPDPKVLKSSAAEDVYDVYFYKINFGYQHQLARNNLQINNQNGTFSEIALASGVAATDWSWSTLFADFDLDGHKDIFIANGIPGRMNDLDYINFMSADSLKFRLEQEVLDRDLKLIEKMPKIKIANYIFRNNRDSTFTNVARDWGMGQPAYSNGAAYSDLDNDGDLDLVVNNINEEAFVYENKSVTVDKPSGKTFIQFSLKGPEGNVSGLGTKIFVYSDGGMQFQECNATRGFQSAVDTKLTFGLSSKLVDSVLIVWQDSKFQTIKKPAINSHHSVDHARAAGQFDYTICHSHKTIFDHGDEVTLPFRHRENNFVEFNREQLLPHMLSAEGPASAVADVDGDSLEDIFIGGGKWQESVLLRQSRTGVFERMLQPSISSDSVAEDVSAVFFDADNDGDQDLFVVSGGNEFSGKSENCKPRLYLNNGRGLMTKSSGVADIYLTGSCVAPADFDNDGDIDLFVGARTTPWHYGFRPDSYLLVNDGKGKFSDMTNELAPELRKFGFVKHASWGDMNGDGKIDLILAAEWQPITILVNQENKLTLHARDGSGFEHTSGWWNVVEPVDLDGDGDLDIVAGNLGNNSKLQATPEQPVRMYVGDFDRNDSTDQIITHFIGGQEYVLFTRDELTKQMPFLKKKFLSYRKFAETTMTDMFPPGTLEKSDIQKAEMFSSCVFYNLGGGKFNAVPLPKAAQISTVNAISVVDVNNDEMQDVILAGNFNRINIQLGRNDASYGLLCVNDGNGKLVAVPAVQSGISVAGEVRSVQKIMVGDREYLVFIRNNESPELYTMKPK